MNGNCRITEHRLRARGRDDDMMIAVRSLRAVCERIAKMPELAVLLLADDFEIGDCGQQYRVPVDEALAAIEQAGFMQPDEMFDDRLRIRGVNRERFARPVDAGPHATALAPDRVGRKFFPFPDISDQLLSATVAPTPEA